MKYKYIITAILAGLLALFVCLNTVWDGSSYVAAALLIVLALYWAAVFIYNYVDDYKWNFEADFALYKANVINSTSISEKDFEIARKFYIKKFKRSLVRDKIIDIFKILFCFSIVATSLVAIFCWGI